MSAKPNAPVIIKKKRSCPEEGHHGGAWKVAYADFVTAMMAFFMLMWLLNATTEKQRKGIADYFSPTIPVNRISGGGEGSFGGDSVFTEETLSRNGTGASSRHAMDSRRARGDAGLSPDGTELPARDELRELADSLMGRGGESMVSDRAARHILTRVTDEGLIVEIFDGEDEPLFASGTAKETPLLREIAQAMVEAFRLVRNQVSVEGHVRSHPVVLERNPVWDLSEQRADRMRRLLGELGLQPARIRRVIGHADRELAAEDPMAARNNRLELILLRSDR